MGVRVNQRGERSSAVTRTGDLAVVSDSDGGGRCYSTLKRFIEHSSVVVDPTRSLLLCGKTAFSYVQIPSFLGAIRLNKAVELPVKGEMAV